MTNAAIEKKLTRMQADIAELKRGMKISAADQKARARLRGEILKGLNSGEGVPITAQYWKKKRALIKRAASHRK